MIEVMFCAHQVLASVAVMVVNQLSKHFLIVTWELFMILRENLLSQFFPYHPWSQIFSKEKSNI